MATRPKVQESQSVRQSPPKPVQQPAQEATQQSGQEPLDLLVQRAKLRPGSISPADANRLQRTIGNQAISHLYNKNDWALHTPDSNISLQAIMRNVDTLTTPVIKNEQEPKVGANAIEAIPSISSHWSRSSVGMTMIQGLFLPDAKRDIAEDRSTLIKEYYKARKANNKNDMEAIMNKQGESQTRPPALIPMGWTPDSEFESEVGLYGMASDMLEQSISGKPGWRIGMQLFELVSDMYFAEDFVNEYNVGNNPKVSLEFLTKLKAKGVLQINVNVARRSAGGANATIYYFKIQGTNDVLGEWHVHWERGNRAGNPGWKWGKAGDKNPTGDEMRGFLGDYWGHDKSTGSYKQM